jgi:hypothetical protein
MGDNRTGSECPQWVENGHRQLHDCTLAEAINSLIGR